MASFKSPYSFSTSPIFSINTSSNIQIHHRHGHQPPSATQNPIHLRLHSPLQHPQLHRRQRLLIVSDLQRFTSRSSLYEVLGLQIGADTVEIKAAYRRLARVLHPDVGNLDSSADEFIRVHSAYATLSDPGKRADYDRSLFAREELAVQSCSAAGYGGRRWETDQCW